MGNLEELKKLTPTPVERKIPRKPKEGQQQATLEIHPLGLDELKILEDVEKIFEGKEAPFEDQVKAMKKFIAKSLNVGEDQVNLSLGYFRELLEEIMDANGFPRAQIGSKEKLEEFMAQKKKMMAQKKDVQGTTG